MFLEIITKGGDKYWIFISSRMKNITVTGRKIVYLKEIGEIWIPEQSTACIENLVVFEIPENIEKHI